MSYASKEATNIAGCLQLALWLAVILIGFYTAATGAPHSIREVGLYFAVAGISMFLSTIWLARKKHRIRIRWVQPDKFIARLSFAFIVLPTALIGFYGFLLSIECVYDYCNRETAIFAPTIALFSVCVVSLWIKTFVSSPDKYLSRTVQAVLLLGVPFIMAFTFILESVFAFIVGVGYILALASMAMTYYYNRSKVESTCA